MATCENCGCKLGTTVETPIDRSLAFTALLDLDPAFGPMESGKGSERITAFLADWHKSGHTSMYDYAREWVDQQKIAEHYGDEPGHGEECGDYIHAPHRPAEPTGPSPARQQMAADLRDGKITYGEAQETIMNEIMAHQASGNPYQQYTPESRVWAKAQENGKAAASWVIDGSTSAVSARGIIKGIEDGDPEVMDAFRASGLSGEFAGDYSEDELMTDVGYVPHDGTLMRDDLATQYNTEVSSAFWHEVERLARNAIPEPEAREGDQ